MNKRRPSGCGGLWATIITKIRTQLGNEIQWLKVRIKTETSKAINWCKEKFVYKTNTWPEKKTAIKMSSSFVFIFNYGSKTTSFFIFTLLFNQQNTVDVKIRQYKNYRK